MGFEVIKVLLKMLNLSTFCTQKFIMVPTVLAPLFLATSMSQCLFIRDIHVLPFFKGSPRDVHVIIQLYSGTIPMRQRRLISFFFTVPPNGFPS